MPLPLIPIIIAAAGSYVVGKIVGQEEGKKEGYDEGLKKNIIISLRKQCPPEFKDRVKSVKPLREHGENRATVAYLGRNSEVLCRAEVVEQGIGRVLRENPVLYL